MNVRFVLQPKWFFYFKKKGNEEPSCKCSFMDSTSGSSAETSLFVSISPLCLSHYWLKLAPIPTAKQLSSCLCEPVILTFTQRHIEECIVEKYQKDSLAKSSCWFSKAGTFRYSEHSLQFWLNSLLHIEIYLSPLFFLLTCLIFQLYVHPFFKLQLPLLLFLSIQLIPLNSILYPPKKQRCHL